MLFLVGMKALLLESIEKGCESLKSLRLDDEKDEKEDELRKNEDVLSIQLQSLQQGQVGLLAQRLELWSDTKQFPLKQPKLKGFEQDCVLWDK